MLDRLNKELFKPPSLGSKAEPPFKTNRQRTEINVLAINRYSFYLNIKIREIIIYPSIPLPIHSLID